MRRYLVLAVAAVLFIAPGCEKKADKAAVNVPDDKLAGEVEDWTLSREELGEFLSHLPDQQRTKYSTPEGMAELTQKLMQEELAYREAQKMKIQDRDDVKKQIEQARRSILVSTYLDDVVDVKARPTDEELHEYYEAHLDQYTKLETIRAYHIFSKDKAKLEDLKRRIEEGGEKFTNLAHIYSEDTLTKNEGGDLGYFNPGGYIKSIGFSQTFSDAVELMEPGKIYGPIKWEQGYSLVRIGDKQPAEVNPYDDVREDIAKRLSEDKIEVVRAEHFASVEKNYKTRNFMKERYGDIQRSPQELFDFAQNSSDPHQRIEAFQQIVDKFPDDKVAPEAQFMIGFVYAEEIKDIVMADRAFTAVIEKYPDSQMAQTARWMLDNLDKPLPKFEDLDDLNQQIEKKSN